MTRLQGPKHRIRQHRKSTTVGAAAFLAAGILTGLVSPPAQLQAAACSHRPVYADPRLAALYEWGIPGSGGTTLTPPEVPPSNIWLDGGIWADIPAEQHALLDKNAYPAVLGITTQVTFSDGTTRTVTGQDSVNMGSDALLAAVKEQLAKDPKAVFLFNAGSQGSMVVVMMLIKAKAEGIDLSNMFVALYSNPYTKGTGFIDRFGLKDWALTTGFKGQSPTIPEGPTVIIINHENDPMAHMFKYLYLAPIGILNAVLGWYEHGDLESLDWWNPLNKVTVDDNVTTYTIKSKVVPLLLPLVALGFKAGISKERMYELLKPLNDILEPLIKMTGTDDPGKFTLFPKPDVFKKQVLDLIKGIVVNAPRDLVKLIMGKPVFVPEPTGELTPTQQLIKDAEEREKMNSGTTGAMATVFATPATQKQVDPQASPTTTPNMQPEESPTTATRQGTQPETASQASAVQKQAQEPETSEKTPRQSYLKPSDSSDTPKDNGDTAKPGSSSANQADQIDSGDGKLSDSNKRSDSQPKHASAADSSDSSSSSTPRHRKPAHSASAGQDTASSDASNGSSQPKPKSRPRHGQTEKYTSSVAHSSPTQSGGKNS